MIELNELMRDCLSEANDSYPDLDFADTIIVAFDKYVNIVGAPMEVENEEEGEALFNEAGLYLIECVLANLMDKGLVDVVGIDESGDWLYQAIGN